MDETRRKVFECGDGKDEMLILIPYSNMKTFLGILKSALEHHAKHPTFKGEYLSFTGTFKKFTKEGKVV